MSIPAPPGGHPDGPPGRSRRRAFTLLELVVAIITIAVLVAVTVLGYAAYVRHAREVATKANLVQIGRLALVEAARTDSELTRELIAESVAQLPGGITPGWNAAGSSWDLLKSAQIPAGSRQLAVGFDTGEGTAVSDTTGTRVVVLAHAYGSRLMALELTKTGGARVYWAKAGIDTPAEALTDDPTAGMPGNGAPGDGGPSGEEPPVPPPLFPPLVPISEPDAVTVKDTFNRTNATTLGVTSDGTQTWNALLGTFRVSSNQAYVSTVTGTKALAVLNAGSANQTVEATLPTTSSTGVAFRVVDKDNFWYATYGTTGGTVRIMRVTGGGSPTVEGTIPNVTGSGASSTKPLRVSVHGAEVTASSGGVLVGSWSSDLLTTGAFGTAKLAGLFANHAYYSLDEMTVAGNAALPPLPVQTPAWSTGNGTVTLTWAKIADADVLAFKVYRDGIQVGQVDGATFTFTDTKPVATHDYTVVPVDVYGQEPTTSAAVVKVLTVPGPVTVIDTFDRVNGPLGVTSDTRQAWQPLMASWTVNANRAQAGSIAASRALAVLDAGSANQSVEATLTAVAATGVAFRVADKDNFWYATYTGSNGAVNVYQVLGGGSATVQRSFPPVTGGASTKPLRVAAQGDVVTVFSGTTALGSWTSQPLVDGVFASATRAGVWASSASYAVDQVTVTGN